MVNCFKSLEILLVEIANFIVKVEIWNYFLKNFTIYCLNSIHGNGNLNWISTSYWQSQTSTTYIWWICSEKR